MNNYISKIPFKFKPTVIKIFVEDLPKFEHIKEYDYYFDNN